MPEPQILGRMCDNSVNKAVHGLAAILLVRLVGQPPKNVKNEICPHRCFAFYTRTARLNPLVRYAFIVWSLNTVTSLLLHFRFLIFSLYK